MDNVKSPFTRKTWTMWSHHLLAVYISSEHNMDNVKSPLTRTSYVELTHHILWKFHSHKLTRYKNPPSERFFFFKHTHIKTRTKTKGVKWRQCRVLPLHKATRKQAVSGTLPFLTQKPALVSHPIQQWHRRLKAAGDSTTTRWNTDAMWQYWLFP